MAAALSHARRRRRPCGLGGRHRRRRCHRLLRQRRRVRGQQQSHLSGGSQPGTLLLSDGNFVPFETTFIQN